MKITTKQISMFVANDGSEHATREQAVEQNRRSELVELARKGGLGRYDATSREIAGLILEERAEILRILNEEY